MVRPFEIVFWVICSGLLSSMGLDLPADAAELRGYQARVSVQEPTRLDWVFALANQSPAEAPGDWLSGYVSTAQQYELYVPPALKPKQPAAAFVFISPGAQPAGWKEWQSICEARGIIFASPYAAGNDCPMQRRVRIVMDVLDDLRRRYNIDPDRTYIGGFSGGGRVACAIAFALPEYFGGAVPVCAGEELRQESWLRQRVTSRLHVALLTGENDFNRGEVERFRGPLLSSVGVQARVWVFKGLGHGIPSGPELAEVFKWLDAGAARRKKLAAAYPASRIAGDKPLSREAWSEKLLAEGKERLAARETQYSGLMQLQGVMVRWSDLPAAQQARTILAQYEAKAERPWEADDLAEQRLYMISRVRALDAYASGALPPQYANMRSDMAQAAIALWEMVIQDGEDAKAVEEARTRIPELKKLTEAE